MAARSKSWFCGSSLAGITVSNPTVDMDVCLLLSVVCCRVEVCAIGRSLVQGNPTVSHVSECDRGISTKGRPRPTRPVEPLKRKKERKKTRTVCIGL